MHLNLYRNNSAKTHLVVKEKVRNLYTLRRSDTFRKTAQLVQNSDSHNVFDSCMIHGLKLMLDYRKLRWNEISLWNPSIRKNLILPVCPLECKDNQSFLGFAPSSNDYKVVVFDVVNAVAFEIAIAIYSLNAHLWSVKHNRIQVSKQCFEVVDYGHQAVFFQGALYWKPPCSRWNGEKHNLVYFDVDAEEFSYLKLPDIEEEMFRFLFIYGGSLAFFCISELRSCIWIMEKNTGNELWRKCWDRDTNLDGYKFFEVCMKNDYQFLYIEDTGTLLVKCFRKLMAYNIRSNETRYLGKSVSLLHVETYVESLVLHKGYKGVAST